MTEIEKKILEAAMSYIGCPYIWGGKGAAIWSPQGSVLHGFNTPVFDCSGLMTQAFFDAGLGDFKFVHNAQTLFDKLKPPPVQNKLYAEERPLIAFFGAGAGHVTHVGIEVSLYGRIYIIESAGGGSNTLMPTKNAKVMMHSPSRRDMVDLRGFPQSKADLL